MRLLYVEDEAALRDITAKRLKDEGYGVDTCGDGMEALDLISLTSYDAILLDIMLPGADGLQVLRTMREKGDTTPVLLLTARDAVADRVKGLDHGADDYLVKPFHYEELSARIRVMLRRPSGGGNATLSCADLTLDPATRRVTRCGEAISLSRKEFALLEYLLRNQGLVISRTQIEEHVWDYDYEGGSNVIDVYIRSLRKKIDDPYTRKLLHTVRGVGYVLRDEGEAV